MLNTKTILICAYYLSLGALPLSSSVFQLLVLGFHSCFCSPNVVLFPKLKLACEVGDCTVSVASFLCLQYALGGQVWLVIGPGQLQQLSCLGTQPLHAGVLKEGVWARIWVLHVASPGGGQAWGHGAEYVAIVPSVLPA